MGTKREPGDYDCYAAADPNEPIFTLRAKDPYAAHLVRLWVAVRSKSDKLLEKAYDGLLNEMQSDSRPPPKRAKIMEGLKCAMQMEGWRREQGK